ncbi:substrate-binding domain-containing protein [Acerihabitans sp. KWT182]|uniref:Substrate-binding domain-containing protein n=1 Tax=Acerihabitans sp. KWT182 TaxID=3157919 RepID=A0AAU7Q816_9GAMM
MINTSKTLSALSLGLCITLAGGAFSRADAAGDAAQASIALSNSFAGNTWRQQMITIWNQAAKDAISQKLIAKTKVVNADNSAPQQASQLENLILEGWKAIAIDAASPTALNGAIQEACDQGIVVVAFDAKVTAPCAYNVVYDYQNVGRLPAQFLADKLNGKGNVLVVRGLAGTSIDADEYEGAKSVFSKYPGLKIVGMVNGNWTESVAQKEVAGILPALGKVDAVLAQGGGRQLWHLPGLQIRRTGYSADNPGRSQRRAGAVEKTERRNPGRLRHGIVLDGARRVVSGVLGGATSAGG